MLVVTEVALALVLLIGSALLIRTAVALRAVDPGVRRDQRADDADVADRPALPSRQGVEQMVATASSASSALPGVVDVERHLLRAARGRLRPAVHHRRPAPARDGPFHGGGGWLTVSPGYFEVFKIPVKRGRDVHRSRHATRRRS